jgi:hypothetical protein
MSDTENGLVTIHFFIETKDSRIIIEKAGKNYSALP